MARTRPHAIARYAVLLAASIATIVAPTSLHAQPAQPDPAAAPAPAPAPAPSAATHHEPSAGDLSTARNALREGLALREKGDLRGAAARLATAYDLVPTPVTAFELGKTQMMLGLILQADELFKRVVRMPLAMEESARSAAAREESARLAADLEPRIPQLRIRLRVPQGATAVVRIDDDVIPTSGEITPRSVDPGKHEVFAKAGDGPEEKVTVQVVEGETKEVDLAPQWVAPKAAPKGGSDVVYVRQTNPLVFIGFGASSAALVFTGLASVEMVNTTGRVLDHCGQDYCAARVKQGQSGPAIFWSVATVAGAAGTVGFLVMGVVSLNRPISEKVTGQVHPYVGPGAAGVEGTF